MNNLKEMLTKEERREIFKDLCERIYYGVRVVVIRNGEKFIGSLYLVTRDEKFNIRRKDGVVFENNIDIYDESFVFYPMLFKPDYFKDDTNADEVNPFDVNALHDYCMQLSVDMHNLIGRCLSIDIENYKGNE